MWLEWKNRRCLNCTREWLFQISISIQYEYIHIHIDYHVLFYDTYALDDYFLPSNFFSKCRLYCLWSADDDVDADDVDEACGADSVSDGPPICCCCC